MKRRIHAFVTPLGLIAALALALGLLVAAVGAQPAGTLLVGLVAEPVNLDPAQVTDLNSNRVGRRVVEALVAFPDESTQVIPGLAESWKIVDPKTILFNLSGHGHFDMAAYDNYLAGKLEDVLAGGTCVAIAAPRPVGSGALMWNASAVNAAPITSPWTISESTVQKRCPLPR